jgi:hypothetical protein
LSTVLYLFFAGHTVLTRALALVTGKRLSTVLYLFFAGQTVLTRALALVTGKMLILYSTFFSPATLC